MREAEPTIDAVQERTKVGRGTVQRIRDGDTGTRLTSLIAIAQAFGIEVWQLLASDLDPDALPTLFALKADERALVLAYRQQRDRQKADETTSESGGLAAVERVVASRSGPERIRVARRRGQSRPPVSKENK